MRRLPSLYAGGREVFRSRLESRVLRRADIELGVTRWRDAGGLHLWGLGAIVRAGSAVLVPEEVLQRSSAVERAVAAAGCTIAESNGLSLDPSSMQLHVHAGLAGWGSNPMLSDPLATVPGRYEVEAIFWTSQAPPRSDRTAAALVRLLGHLPLAGAAPHLEPLSELARRTSPLLLAEKGVSDLGPVFDLLPNG